jgi:transcriptional regulator with XRE-family HTH domain
MPRSSVGGLDCAFTHLAEHLVQLRRAARLTQRTLADSASISRGAVQRAESGTAAPSPTVLDAYLRACGASSADHARAHLLRNRGRTTQRDKLRELMAPAPALIHTEDDLGAALAAAYERAGAPPLRDLNLPGRAPLPTTTAWRIVHRKGLPATVRQLMTFLTACRVRPADHQPYIDAYINADRGNRPIPPPRRQLTTRLHHPSPPRGSTDEPREYTSKISTPFQSLLAALSPEDVETVLTAGTAHLLEERGRLNGTDPAVPQLQAATPLPGYGSARDDGVAINDTYLIERMRGGDNAAFEQLYQRHAHAVLAYARAHCRNARIAENLTGETFARMLQAVRGGSGPKRAVRAYLLTTVRRLTAQQPPEPAPADRAA